MAPTRTVKGVVVRPRITADEWKEISLAAFKRVEKFLNNEERNAAVSFISVASEEVERVQIERERGL